jgi:hypothetical protein
MALTELKKKGGGTEQGENIYSEGRDRATLD